MTQKKKQTDTQMRQKLENFIEQWDQTGRWVLIDPDKNIYIQKLTGSFTNEPSFPNIDKSVVFPTIKVTLT